MFLWVLLESFFKLLLLPYKCVWCSFGFWYIAGGAVLASGLSILGFESVGDAVTPSSEPALLLRLAEPLALFGIVLHTESSDLERPMKRDTLPVPERAASIRVPTEEKCCGSLRNMKNSNNKLWNMVNYQQTNGAKEISCIEISKNFLH